MLFFIRSRSQQTITGHIPRDKVSSHSWDCLRANLTQSSPLSGPPVNLRWVRMRDISGDDHVRDNFKARLVRLSSSEVSRPSRHLYGNGSLFSRT